MGLARDAIRAVSVAAAAGIAVGGALGLLAPSSAAAVDTPPAPAAAARPAIVTSVDLLGRAQLSVTVRFTNTGRATEHLTGFDVLADGRPLTRLGVEPAALDLRPGATADETVSFTAPTPAADLTLTLPDGVQLPLEL
ncbi:hypothetical protein ABT369_34895 [Dactylosporangium sp. NPDC000244]|uniref:hypothetical protein n=1 Tax=Dactylosporangium sp. NPDC000244 TaxID=3154365 RepID=UPI00331D90F6